MSITWKPINTFSFSPESSRELFNEFCDNLGIEHFMKSSFHERVFRTGTFRGYDYNTLYGPTNKSMTIPFCDHSYYFRTKKDANGQRTTYFVSQPYLNEQECKGEWVKFLAEEEKIVSSIKIGNPNYKAPLLECVILGKDKSFYYPNNTNLVIIGRKEDIQKLNIQ